MASDRRHDEQACDPQYWVALVRSRAGAYFPDIGVDRDGVRAHTVNQRGQTLQVLIHVPGETADRTVVVKAKAQLPRARIHPVLGRPRDPHEKHVSEYRALGLLEDAVDGVPGVTAVRPLDHVPEHRAILTEYLPSTSLREVLYRDLKAWRRERLEGLLRSAGVVTRLFHDLPAPSDGTGKLPDRAPFEEIAPFVDHLRRRLGDVSLLRAIEESVSSHPVDLGRSGLHHGDLAPRNLLVTPAGDLACIDMLASRPGPVAVDLAAFRVGLRTALAPHRIARLVPGEGRVRRAEEAFLRGYLGSDWSPATVHSIRRAMELQEVPFLLARWVSLVETREGTTRARTLRALQRRQVTSWLEEAVALLSKDQH